MVPNRHIVILLTSLALIIVQFIVELIIASFLITLFPTVGVFLYTQKIVFVITHIIITVALLWFAGRCSDSYCRKKKENLQPS